MKATDRKLVAASRALLALVSCEDIDARLEAHWRKVTDGHFMDSGFVMPAGDEPPFHSGELLRVAAALAQIASPE